MIQKNAVGASSIIYLLSLGLLVFGCQPRAGIDVSLRSDGGIEFALNNQGDTKIDVVDVLRFGEAPSDEFRSVWRIASAG